MARILFFSPNSAIESFAYPEALIAEALQKEGNAIIYITCGEVFSDFCVSMAAYGLTHASSEAQKKKICTICNDRKIKIKKDFNFNGYDLKNVLEKEDLIIVEDMVAKTTRENILDLVIDTVPVGRISLCEVLMSRKKKSMDFTENEWKECLSALKCALISFYAARKIVIQERPDFIVAYSPDYSVNHAFCLYAKSLKIPFYAVHAGGNISNALSTMIVAKTYTSEWLRGLIIKWEVFKEIPVNSETLSLVSNHFIELFTGLHNWVYSAKRAEGIFNLRDKFGIHENQKILVATMSSYDERFSGEVIGRVRTDLDLIFPTQHNWIAALIEYVKTRPNLFLIIRVHPREFPNKRDSVKSEHASSLEKIFIGLPSNAVVNWPTDNISLYDIAEDADVFLNAWSSTGKEMSLLGIPVVIYSQDLVYYPADLNYLGTTKDDYFAKIELALKDGWSFERIRKTYRWYALEHKYALFDISERYPEKARTLSLVQRGFRKIIRKIAPAAEITFKEKDRIYMEKHKKPLSSSWLIHEVIVGQKDTVLDILSPESFKKVSVDQETKYLKYELKRLLHALYPRVEIRISRSSSLAKKMVSAIET